MTTRILHPLLSLLASVTRQELARQVAYLKEENRILRARLPARIVTTEPERRRPPAHVGRVPEAPRRHPLAM